MAWVETRITRTTQPQDAVGIDWNNPLAQGLAFVAVPHFPNPLAGGAGPPTYSAGHSVLPAPSGYAWTDTGSGAVNGVVFPGETDPVGGATAFTSLIYGRLLSIPTADKSLLKKAKSHFFQVQANTGFIVAALESGVSIDAYRGTVAARVGVDTVLGMTFRAPGRTTSSYGVVVNGVLLAASTNVFSSYTPSQVSPNATDTYRINSDGGLNYRGYLQVSWRRVLSAAEVASFSVNPWQIFEPEVIRIWVDDYVFAGGAATVIPIGVQATGSVGTPSATGAARATPAGVSASSAVGTPIAVGGASIPATVLPAGVQATGAVGTVSARGAALALPAGVMASGAVGTPVAIAGTSIPATVLPAGVQASSAVGTPTVTAAAIAQPLGVAAIAYVGTPTIATGVSGVAVAYPAGVQAIGQVGTLITTGAAWTAAVGVQAVASVGAPFAYEGALISATAGAQTRPSRLQSSGRASRIQTGSRASR